jgi:DNA-binding FadR family transcriptional regulator
VGEKSARRGAAAGHRAGRQRRDRQAALKRPLSDRLYDQISQLIVSGELQEGSKLPTEAQLGERFGASRPVVREALARLRANGVIDSRQGSGSYARRPAAAPVADFAPLGSIADLERWYEFRAVIESEAACLAAKWRDGAALARIRAALRELQRELDAGRTGDDADFAFHMAIAGASRNPFFVDTMASVRNQVLFGISLGRSLALRRPAGRNQLVRAEHEAVVAAIRDRSPERARAAMRRHIDNVRKRIFHGKKG